MLGHRSQDDFEDEIRSHLQLEIDRLKAQGMSDAEAERTARRNFGNVGVAEDRFYHGQKWWKLEDAVRDLKHAWRSLLRTPGFLVTSVTTLALAIGAVAGMFTVVNTVLVRPLPFANPGEIMDLRGSSPGSDLPVNFAIGPEFYLHYKERAKTLDGIFAWGGGTSTFRTDTRVERIGMAWTTNDMYATLGVKPIVGRLPRDEDADDVALISERLWVNWFNRDPSVIGKWYFVSDSMKQIIGVMPSEFAFPSDRTMLWVANPVLPQNVNPGTGGMNMTIRRKDGVDGEQLRAELQTLAKEIPGRFGGKPAFQRIIDNFHPVTTPLLDAILGPAVRTSLWILLGAVGVVLLIACANVANLFLVRAESRRRDLTVRRAIGASRTQLVRFQLMEAFAVALAAGVVAVLLSIVTLPLFIKAAPEGIPRLADARLDLSTVAATFGLVLFAAVACGLMPAVRASSPDLSGLREGGRGATGGRQWGRDLLVVGQTALALVLLIGSALLIQSFQRLRNVDPGYTTKDLYTFQYAPDQPQLVDGPTWGQLHLTAMDRLRALPGVTGVGVINNLPLDEGTGGVLVRTEGMSSADGGGTRLSMNMAAGDVFQVLGIKVLKGRVFTPAEAVTPNNSIVLSRSAAEKLWPGQDPLGKIVRPVFRGTDTIALSVIGVVSDVKQNDWRDEGEAVLYVTLTGPSAQIWAWGSPAYVVRSPRAEVLKNEVREVVRRLAPEAPVYREFTMEFLARRMMILLSFSMLTLGVVSALALVLGAIGLYGVLSYVVAQRTREIGVRMALGATAGAVRREVVSQGTKVVVVGVVIGIVAALWSTKWLGALLFGVRPVDPILFAAMSATMIAVGMLASYMPARRASTVDPIEALRSD